MCSLPNIHFQLEENRSNKKKSVDNVDLSTSQVLSKKLSHSPGKIPRSDTVMPPSWDDKIKRPDGEGVPFNGTTWTHPARGAGPDSETRKVIAERGAIV